MKKDTLVPAIALMVIVICGAVAAQVSQTAPPPTGITPPGPQAHQPPSGRPQQLPGTSAPPPVRGLVVGQGVIVGYVYWDTNGVTHTPANSCGGLGATVSVGTPSKGSPTFEQFKSLGTSQNFTSLGNVGSFVVCQYSVQQVPTGRDLQVQISYKQPSFTPAVLATVSSTANNPNGPIKITGGACNKLPPAVPTASVLGSGWWTCGNNAYNVNFVLQPASAGNMMSGGSQITLLSGAPQGGANSGQNSTNPGLPNGTPQSPGMLAPGTTRGAQPGTPTTLLGNRQNAAAQNGGVQNPGTQVELNPQPFPPRVQMTNADVIKMVQAGIPESVIVSSIQSSTKQFDFSPAGIQALQQAHMSPAVLAAMCDGSARCPAIQGDSTPASPGSKEGLNPQPFPPGPGGHAGARNGTLPGNSRIAVALSSPKQGSKITNPKAALRDAAIIAVLQQQRNAADAESTTMKLGIRPAGVQAGTTPSHTMAANGGGAQRTAPAPNQNSALASSIQHPALGALPAPFNNLALTCSHDPSMRALTVSGGPTPVIFTPDPKYNFYTITGCSFGSPGTNSKAYIYYQGTFREDFQIQQWTDNFIQLSLDQNIGGVDDQNNVTLLIQRGDGKQWTKNSYKFYAARQTVLLSSIPRGDFSLNKFRPDSAVIASWKPTYTSASSASVVPNLPGLSAEVHWDITRDPNGTPSGGQDNYDFSHLHSTFALDSTSMEWRDVSCTDPNYNQFASSKNNWSIDWYGNSGVQVSWQGQVCNNTWRSCGTGWPVKSDCFEMAPESNYGVNVWVSGPRGLDPWTGKPIGN